MKVTVVEKPKRNLILKRAREAGDYFTYVDEVGCEVWDQLKQIEDAMDEPMGLWLPEHLVPEGTSGYVQGVEVPPDFQGPIPEGFDMISLAPQTYLQFQGPAYDDENFMDAISQAWEFMETFEPETLGYDWTEDTPCFQYEPIGSRGYIEASPVNKRKA